MPDSPTMSLIVTTSQGWPEVAACLHSCQAALDRVGGELIFLDGSGRQPPPAEELANTRWISEPGKSVFQLRAVGYPLATGAIVATTEDHCVVPPDWAQKMLEAHRLHPSAAVVGGAVENGATGGLLDWASYFVVQIANMPPLRNGAARRLAGHVNVSYKREALENMPDHGGLGLMDGFYQRELGLSGASLIADDRILVHHDQSLGFRRTAAAHFHAGRTIGAVWRQKMDANIWGRAIGTFVIPWLRAGRIVYIGARKRRLGLVAKCLPVMIWLLYCQASGQFLGLAAGPGDSPMRVQ